MLKMNSVTLSVVVLTVTALLVMLSTPAAADCRYCYNQKKICFTTCITQTCLDNCDIGYNSCLQRSSCRRFLLRDVLKENYKNQPQLHYETLF
ncbi:unnamed protein product [Pocillopora meandrina]|uniref:Uncharacterized protein n=1 Tax=Pocillopora meandrina TaxID=46732 RepID=A0AAU9WH68_9CNID|nr:unnamed protein product [Pocillopora meandrina]